MRAKIVTPAGEAGIYEIAAYIANDNPAAAHRYLDAALDAFFDLPDLLVPVKANDLLPEHVRSLAVPGFAGYTLHIAIFDTETYLVAAYRPGLTAHMQAARTQESLDDV